MATAPSLPPSRQKRTQLGKIGGSPVNLEIVRFPDNFCIFRMLLMPCSRAHCLPHGKPRRRNSEGYRHCRSSGLPRISRPDRSWRPWLRACLPLPFPHPGLVNSLLLPSAGSASVKRIYICASASPESHELDQLFGYGLRRVDCHAGTPGSRMIFLAPRILPEFSCCHFGMEDADDDVIARQFLACAGMPPMTGSTALTSTDASG